jgi:hypothetical protein
MKPEVISYEILGVSYLAIRINNICIINIACSEEIGFGNDLNKKRIQGINIFLSEEIKVRARDLALYTHWPQHTKEFWDLLNET